jgi:hypothetical protein
MKEYILGVLIMAFCLGGLAYAGDSSSLAVSCTIPIIPGVNAPLLEQEQLQSSAERENKEPISEESQEIIQQDSKATVASTSHPQVLVKTFYAR